MSVTGDVDFAENKKRHTRTVEERLHDLHICQPELPVHKCGLDKRQFVDVSVANTLSLPLVLFISLFFTF